MLLPDLTPQQLDCLRDRRRRLSDLTDAPVLLWSGQQPSRNFPANKYPFRASSHFLFFAGMPIPYAAIKLEGGKLTLFADNPPPSAALWHGPSPDREAIAQAIGADEILSLEQASQQEALTLAEDPSSVLAKAIVRVRLCQDAGAIAEIRRAAAVSISAHKAGMAVTPQAKTEAEVRAAMESVILGHNMTTAYNSIVTVHGEVLHNEVYSHKLGANDLLLADVGAETELGWASDITRTWPVSGKFSSTQRDLYDVVLAAHDACMAAVKPGAEYREIHLLACKVLAEGLVDLGILQGEPEGLVEQDAHALFFPHGVGHLLGLDVHDMEDLGDVAGYEEGRERSDRFGLGYLRLNRPLETGMVVTIEPGFYQVPAILENPEFREKHQGNINWERLAQFSDVRGIRIENDVLVTVEGAEVLTADLPTDADTIEGLVLGGA